MASQMQKVKNKSPAAVQITAEQLIREAWERQEAKPSVGPRYHLADSEELRDYQRVKRKEFEDKIIRNRAHIPIWIRYAKWEELQNELARARSIFERAIDYDHRSHILWLHYAEMEIRASAVNHARNVWDRAVAILPRVSQLWLRYSYMEEVMGNIPLARLVFKRWMEWHPESIAYASFVKFEIRNENIPGARNIYELYIRAHPATKTYLRYAKFEEKFGNNTKARNVYERASEELPEYLRFSTLYKAFAAFEERSGEFERARAIYKFAVQTLPDKYADDIAAAYTAFEKQRGGTQHIELVLVQKRRAEYEKILEMSVCGYNYDTWFNLVELEESVPHNEERIRKVYERAIEQVPKLETKRSWQRYIYLWIQYACWEELKNNNQENASDIYRRALKAVPHGKFSFGKMFRYAAQLEVRRKNLPAARKIMGHGLGILPNKHSLYRMYIDMELTLTNIDKARILYRKWIERNPTNTAPYTEYARMEEELGEIQRARQIFEVALDEKMQEQLDIPEIIWKAYIDLEIRAEEQNNAVGLYERMLKQKMAAVRLSVWLSYAKLVAGAASVNIEEDGKGDDDSGDGNCGIPPTRKVFQRGYRALRDAVIDSKSHTARNSAFREDTATLLNAWLEWEKGNSDGEGVEKVRKLLPTKRPKKKRPSMETDQEEMEYVFPDERVNKPQLKLLQFAKNWKVRKLAEEQEDNGEDEEGTANMDSSESAEKV